MKIYIPNISDQGIGGGWTFLRNLRHGLGDKVEFVDRWQDCDIYFIVSVTMTDRGELEEAYKAGKLIVFRVDNVPKKSRNKRSRVYDNMRRFSEVAQMVVYQSEWAQSYASALIHADTPAMVIINGVDKEIFRRGPEPEDESFVPGSRYLYVQYNRDENKRFPEAAYYFHKIHRNEPRAKLTIVGNFSPENFNEDGSPHFDFFDKEQISFIPPVASPEAMSSIYQDHDILLFPAFADAAPNTVLEARACGLQVQLVNPVGGTKEMLEPELDISLERMCAEYLGLFSLLMQNKTLDI